MVIQFIYVFIELLLTRQQICIVKRASENRTTEAQRTRRNKSLRGILGKSWLIYTNFHLIEPYML